MVLFTNICLGQRVEVFWGRGVFRGSVQFKGNLSNKRGDWVGIALDKPVGEHNGLVSGRRYFQCKDKHGIFARADKIRFIPTIRCLYDRYHKVADRSYIEEPLFNTPRPDVKNGPYDPISLSDNDFTRARSSLGDYGRPSSSLWDRPQQHHLRQAISGYRPAATMRRPGTTQETLRYRSSPLHTQYSIEDDFITRPSMPKTHMPHSALVRQVRRGWGGSHYVREMSVATGRDMMKLGQWNDISA